MQPTHESKNEIVIKRKNYASREREKKKRRRRERERERESKCHIVSVAHQTVHLTTGVVSHYIQFYQ